MHSQTDYHGPAVTDEMVSEHSSLGMQNRLPKAEMQSRLGLALGLGLGLQFAQSPNTVKVGHSFLAGFGYMNILGRSAQCRSFVCILTTPRTPGQCADRLDKCKCDYKCKKPGVLPDIAHMSIGFASVSFMGMHASNNTNPKPLL